MAEKKKEETEEEVPEFFCIFHPEVALVDIVNNEFKHHQSLKSKVCPKCGWMPNFITQLNRVQMVRAGGRVLKETVNFI